MLFLSCIKSFWWRQSIGREEVFIGNGQSALIFLKILNTSKNTTHLFAFSETYQRMELEKKRNKVSKQAYKGPVIRFHSVTMPLIEELPEDHAADLKDAEKCARTFITFTDEKVFKDNFLYRKKRAPVRQYRCPVTEFPAKYFDPVTQTPFANVKAFKVIRDAYEKQLEIELAKIHKKGQ